MDSGYPKLENMAMKNTTAISWNPMASACLMAAALVIGGCAKQGGEQDAAGGAVSKRPQAAPASASTPSPSAASGAATAPTPENATATAPEKFKARFRTSNGDFVIEVTRAWSPRGADRFYNLVKIGYFDEIAFFRVIPGFMAQFGIHGDPAISAKWRAAKIQDDPVKTSNKRGYLTFAMAGPNTRTVQFFISFRDNGSLDSQGFSPFGRVVEGMSVIDGIYDGYGEGAPSGRGPAQGAVQTQGNAYLKKSFPKLDYILSASVE